MLRKMLIFLRYPMVHRAGPRDRLMKQLEFFSFAVRHRKCVHQPAPLLESVFTSFDSLHHTWVNHMFSSCLVQYFCVEALLGTFSLCLFVVAYYKRACKNIVEPLKARSSVSWMNENVFFQRLFAYEAGYIICHHHPMIDTTNWRWWV